MAAPTSRKTLWYVVGVTRTDPEPELLAAAPTLLPDRPLETIAASGLCAVACKVPDDVLDERAVNDLGRLGRLARSHDEVLRGLAQHSAVVPARLGSLYRSRQDVADMLHHSRQVLSAALDRLTGRAEWGVKVYAEPGDDPPTRSPRNGPGSGTAYLREKRAERQRRMDVAQTTASLAAELHRSISARAHAAVTRPQQHPTLSGIRAPMLLNAAYLVDGIDQEAFTTLVRQLAERHRPAGLRIDLTGPWPPYSFAALGG